MTITNTAVRYGKKRLVRKMMRAIPYIGGVVAIVTLGVAVRRKGLLRGTAHSALDAIPFVGGVKNLAEAARGRDFFPDRPPRDAAQLGR
jgi:hypothetical protein